MDPAQLMTSLRLFSIDPSKEVRNTRIEQIRAEINERRRELLELRHMDLQAKLCNPARGVICTGVRSFNWEDSIDRHANFCQELFLDFTVNDVKVYFAIRTSDLDESACIGMQYYLTVIALDPIDDHFNHHSGEIAFYGEWFSTGPLGFSASEFDALTQGYEEDDEYSCFIPCLEVVRGKDLQLL